MPSRAFLSVSIWQRRLVFQGQRTEAPFQAQLSPPGPHSVPSACPWHPRRMPSMTLGAGLPVVCCHGLALGALPHPHTSGLSSRPLSPSRGCREVVQVQGSWLSDAWMPDFTFYRRRIRIATLRWVRPPCQALC